MSLDTELDVWRQQWQSDTTVPPNLRRMVERQTRWMRISLAADILVTIAVGGFTAGRAVLSPQPDIVSLAGATWLFLAAAWAFSLTINRGNWSPVTLDTAAFVDLSVRRCRAWLAATWFGAGLFLCELTFCLGWVYQHSGDKRAPLPVWLFFSSIPIDVVWLFTLAFAVTLVWFRRKKAAELAYLLSLRAEAPESPPLSLHLR